jgi:hypothetical protein
MSENKNPDNNNMVGAPSPVLLEAKQWEWEHVSGPHTIELLNTMEVFRGNDEGLELKCVEFDVADDIDALVWVGTITKALYSSGKYPKLLPGQVFALANILVDKEKNSVTIIGNVIKEVKKEG